MNFYNDETKKEIEIITTMQQILESFSKQENFDINEQLINFKTNSYINHFLKDTDLMHQLLWSLNIFLRIRPKNSKIYINILVNLIPDIKSNKITPVQLLNIFLHSKFNNFIATDALYHENYITIYDVLAQSAAFDFVYDYYKELLDRFYNKIIEESSRKNLSQKDFDFARKYEILIESHKFIQSSNSLNLFNQSENIQKLANYIKNDDIDSFQDYISNTNFDLQSKYNFQEIYTINSIYFKKEISFIEYSAYHGSLQIFKFLWNQPNKTITKDLPLYSICGGNYDIIHIVESDSNFIFDLECLIASIELHLYDITEYLMTTKDIKFPFENEYLSSYPYLFRIIYSYNMTFISNNFESFEFVINSIDDKTGFTPIQTAAYLGLTPIVKVLSEVDGVDLMQTCRSGENALYIACLKGYVQIVQFLINSGGININCKTDNGMNALHAVVQNENSNNIEIIKLLLSNGIDANSFNRILFYLFFLI